MTWKVILMLLNGSECMLGNLMASLQDDLSNINASQLWCNMFDIVTRLSSCNILKCIHLWNYWSMDNRYPGNPQCVPRQQTYIKVLENMLTGWYEHGHYVSQAASLAGCVLSTVMMLGKVCHSNTYMLRFICSGHWNMTTQVIITLATEGGAH